MADNHITVVGNVTRDPELRFMQTGTPLAKFGLAVNRKVKDEEHTTFLEVVAWQSLAENVAESLRKGDRVIVTGRGEVRTWETDKGEKRSAFEIVADDIGPSLRWATSSTTKVKGAQRREQAPAPATKPEPDYDEEPF